MVQNVSSQIVTFENNNQPLRRRIVPTGAVGEFKLLWSSATSTTPTMKWGTVSGKYTNTIAATTTTYTRADMCGAPANTTGWRDPGLIHSALMQGLDKYAAQRLYYIFGDDVTNDYSPEYTFQTPPLAGKQPPNRPTSVCMCNVDYILLKFVINTNYLFLLYSFIWQLVIQ